jgi:flagellar hook-associated protein 2
MDLGISGLASGFDWLSLVDQLTEVERAPQQRMRSEQTLVQQRNTAYSDLKTQLEKLRVLSDSLKDPLFFDSRLAKSEDSTTGTATATAGTALGTYNFAFSQLATAAIQQGSSNAGGSLSATDDVSGTVIGSAGFATSVTGGTFTVNGKQVTLSTTDSLQQVFDKISTATAGTVTAAYDSSTDKISLSSSGEIVLGSATDTSNFLQVARLNNTGTGTLASSSALGSVRLSGTLSSANLQSSVSDGGSGAGEFKINGVSIAFNASADSVSGVLARISNSAAGVIASFDSVNDRFTLTNKSSGDMGIAFEDVTGNFLAATKLSGGSLQRGNNLLYTLDGGAELVSQSNTITETSSGLAGLSVTALTEGTSIRIEVLGDNTKIKTALNDFISEYNKTQSLIDTQTASSTDAKGKVTAGILANESDASDVGSTLRSLMNRDVSGLSGTLKRLQGLGFVSNGNDNSLTLGNSTELDEVLANHLGDVRDLFTSSTDGLAVAISGYLEKTVGDDGTLIKHRDNLTKFISSIDTQVSDQERLVQSNRQKLIDSFVIMETAQARISQQLQFLQKIGS